MNKLNKELLERALVEGVGNAEAYTTKGLALYFFKPAGKFYFITTIPNGLGYPWQYVCTKEEYLAAKAEKERCKTVMMMEAINKLQGYIDGNKNFLYCGSNLYGMNKGEFNLTHNKSNNDRWDFICTIGGFNSLAKECETNFGTSQPYEEYKKGYKAMSDTKSEYDIGCYYEFSDCEDFRESRVCKLSFLLVNSEFPYQTRDNGTLDIYKYMRPLTVKAGEIRKPKPLSGFVNANDDDSFSFVYSTRKHADDSADNNRIACIDLSQFNEGEGLK